MKATLTIQGDPARDTWSAVKAAAPGVTDLPGWQVVRIRAEPTKHKVVLELMREDGE